MIRQRVRLGLKRAVAQGKRGEFYSHVHQHERLKRLQAVERAAPINRILLFFRHDETGPYVSDADLALCKSLEGKLIIRG